MIRRTVLVEWKTERNALVHALLPRSRRVQVKTDQSVAALLRQVTDVDEPPARVLLHFDITEQERLPNRRAWFVCQLQRRQITVWNSQLSDISKSVIQRWNRKLRLPNTEARPEGRADELVIVKTRWNAFGKPEHKLTREERAALGLRNRSNPITDQDEYPVLPRARIPNDWWSNSALFLERYITNRKGEFFRVFFSGRNCVLCVGTSDALVKRTENGQFRMGYLMTRRRATDPSGSSRMLPTAWTVFKNAVGFAHAFGLDYGAIDLVRDDKGVPYVVDVNPTPAGTVKDIDPAIRKFLRSGFQRPWLTSR